MWMILLAGAAVASSAASSAASPWAAPEAPSAAAPAATASLSWTRGLGWVELGAPAGWHVAPDAPSALTVGSLEVAGMGDLTGLRFPLAEGPVAAELGFAVCTDAGTTCVPVRLQAKGTVAAAKGQLAFTVPAVASRPVPAPGAPARLLDFGAVWCPPCNLLNAEILHDPDEATLLAPYEIMPIDVDRKESWSLKDRYSVGGYPTLVAVDAAGNEVARLVGYPGEEETRAWIRELTQVTPLHRLLDAAPSGSGEECAAVARRLAEGQYESAARRWLAAADDGTDAHIARLMLDGRPEDADWLLAYAPSGPWLLGALEARPEAWPKALTRIPALPPVDAADVLYQVAEIVGGDPGRALKAAAITTLRATFTGVPEHDRAHVTFLAELYAGVGDTETALALLDEYALQFPGEFTFEHAATRILVDQKRWQQAERRGRMALDKAWGDQRLRAVQPLARAIAEQGRLPEALALLDAELARTPLPEEGIDVRTPRYVAQVQALRRELPATIAAGVTPPPR